MGKLSISVPDELERELRQRAVREGTTLSALLTTAAEHEFQHADRVAAADQLLREAIAEHGPPTPDEVAEANATLARLQAFFAEEWSQAS